MWLDCLCLRRPPDEVASMTTAYSMQEQLPLPPTSCAAFEGLKHAVTVFVSICESRSVHAGVLCNCGGGEGKWRSNLEIAKTRERVQVVRASVDGASKSPGVNALAFVLYNFKNHGFVR